MPGLTYLGNSDALSWGAQGVGTLRLSDNDNDYSLGDRFNLTTWVARNWTSQFSSSLRVNGEWWSNIDGSDRKLSPMAPNMVPTADPNKRAGRRFDLLVGANFSPDSGWLAGQTFAAAWRDVPETPLKLVGKSVGSGIQEQPESFGTFRRKSA